MPVTATRDDEQRRVDVTVTDPWSVEEIALIVDRQVTDGTWGYPVIYDLRLSAWVPTEPDVQWLVRRGQQQAARHGPRGRVAVVLAPERQGGPLAAYAAQADGVGGLSVRVFVDRDSAERWVADEA